MTANPTLERFLHHAKKFGAECVHETAAEGYLSAKELALLRVELDEIEAARTNGRYTVGQRRRRSKAETAKTIELLSVAGFSKRKIADKLGISDKYVADQLRARTNPSPAEKPADDPGVGVPLPVVNLPLNQAVPERRKTGSRTSPPARRSLKPEKSRK